MRYGHKRRGRQAGNILLDALVSSFTAALLAAAVFPLITGMTRSHELSDDQAKATQMANRMIEHLQLLKPSDLTSETLHQLDLIDPDCPGNPYSFTHVALDEGSGYSPAKVLRHADAKFTIVPISSASVRVDLAIRYTSASGREVTHTTGTIIGGYR